MCVCVLDLHLFGRHGGAGAQLHRGYQMSRKAARWSLSAPLLLCARCFAQVCNPLLSTYDPSFLFSDNAGCVCRGGISQCTPSDLSQSSQLYVWLRVQTLNQNVDANTCGSFATPTVTNVRTRTPPRLSARPGTTGSALIASLSAKPFWCA